MSLVRSVIVQLCAVLCTKAQDVFLGSKSRDVSNQMAQHDGWVFQIMSSGSNMCLDLYGEDSTNGNAVKIWDCNGHESQLWFFDSGSYQMQWGGDAGKCLDAGSMSAGTMLTIWDCNGMDQQLWGFDSDSGAIFSLNSAAQSDASLCMDLSGDAANAGNPIQVWDCNNQWNQQWTIQSGITIRPIFDSALCLDVPGGAASNGLALWMWECNGQASQYWIFEGGTYQIKYAGDSNYCVDAGDLNGGSQLMLWECNGNDQQTWGYDGDTSTMYLAASTDASQCMDLGGGSMQNGAAIQTWSCNSCWNQQWQAWGPNAASQGLHMSARTSLTDDCPPLGPPSPPPSPGPPSPPGPPSGDFCLDEQPGWPRYNSQQDLQNDQAWASYFQLVYGDVPSSGYPICVGSFRMLYLDALNQAGVQTPKLGGRCASSAGEMFKFGQSLFPDGTQAGGMSYSGVGIWHPDQNRQALPGNTWVEITHSKTSEETYGAWYYYMPGSGVWFNTGNTKDFPDHSEAAAYFVGHHGGCGECDSLSAQIFTQACSQGVQSIQYLEHGEPDWKNCRIVSGTISLAIEIVDTCGSGKFSCAQSTWKAGWAGSQDCNCDESKGAYNCQGFVPNW